MSGQFQFENYLGLVKKLIFHSRFILQMLLTELKKNFNIMYIDRDNTNFIKNHQLNNECDVNNNNNK